MTKIIWKEIEEAPDYMVSNRGEILSNRTSKEKMMKTHTNMYTGYQQVILQREKPLKGKTFNVHRLVALAHIPNPEGYKKVNHINLDKTNNHVWNLEWCSQEQNIHHYYASNAKNKPREMKTIEAWDTQGNFLGEFPSINNCAKELGCAVSTVHDILTGVTKESRYWVIKYAGEVPYGM